MSFTDRKTLDITSCETLMKSLGSRGVYIARQLNEIPPKKSKKSTKGRKSKKYLNEFTEYFKERTEYHQIHPEIEDIIIGICRLDWYGENRHNIPLSYRVMLDILRNIRVISTGSLMDTFNFGVRQAQRYCKACILCLKYIRRVLYRFEKITEE